MCGISGLVVPPGQPVRKDVLRRMNATLARRGPDDEGYFVDSAGGCGLGHRRLSIIDLEGGHQPLSSADGQVQVVVNGEIYGFEALRRDLIRRGYTFTTNSDCEVVAHGWVEHGEDLFSRLDGMFALAIWDARTRRLVLARDRMGKKPLYYAFVGRAKDTLLFGSELKAILAHPDCARTVSPGALAQYLVYECVPEDRAIVDGAAKVLPGTFLVYEREARRTRIGTYWRMRFEGSPARAEVEGKSVDALAAGLRDRIREATRARLISDVPLGVLLSGGIDSSTVVAAMAECVPPETIQTFSVTFEDESFDESPHARRVAAHFGTQHHEQQLSPSAMIDILPEVADFMCEPLGDASLMPTYLLSRFTRESVTVALGGDGGDELFLGYPTFQADQVAARLDASLSPAAVARVGRVARSLANLLPVSRKNISLDFKAKRFSAGLAYAPDQRHQAWMGSFTPPELEAVLHARMRGPALAEDPYALVARFRDEADFRDHHDQLVYQYARLYLTADVLVKVDRASMARGLEVRAPLLDTRVVEYANAIRGDLKIHGLTTKYLLKKAAAPWLPEDIIARPKKGFGMPVADWIRGPLAELTRDLLAETKLRREGFFDVAEVTRLLDEHQRGVADHRKPLWTLIAFELWLARFGPGTERPYALDASVDEGIFAARATG